ncbi:MAG: hypothetical protein WD032_03250 [Nitrospirales bacterium]
MMKTMISQKILLVSLVTLQIIGPSWVLALQASNSFDKGTSESQALIAGLGGVVTIHPGDNTKPGFAPKYRTPLSVGDVLTTEEASVAEVLLNNKGLFAIQEYSEAVIGKEDNGSLSVALEVGTAEWSLPPQSPESLSFTFNTPNIRATTKGGLVTVAVQQTFAQLATAPTRSDSFLIRTSLQVKTTPVKNTGLLETFCVSEGDLTVEFSGIQSNTSQQKVVKTGECLGFLDGQLQVMGSKVSLDDWRAVCAVGKHCEIPESAKKLIAKKQMGQALALERALVGSDDEDANVDEQIVIATTGQSLGASIEGSGPGDPGAGGVILPTTGDEGGSDLGAGGGDSGTGGGDPGSMPPITLSPSMPANGDPPVVLVNNTQALIDRQAMTEEVFMPFAVDLGYTVDELGAVVVVAGTPGNPSVVESDDRLLAVLDGSSLKPAAPSVTTGLIGIQDSTLKGPTTPPIIGQDAQGNDIVRSDIPPLIEVIDGEVETNFAVSVGSTSLTKSNDPLDQALLEASAPLLAMIRGTFTANTEFGLVAGKNAELRANLAGALVSLDASSMVVNGNLFRVTKGGLLNVAGNLLSLTGGSTFSLNGGTLVSVESGSVFTLQNGALVNFGTGTNTVNITNDLCSGGGCFSPFANPSFQVAGNPANFSAPNGFDPFVNVGNLPDGSVNTVNVAPGSAVLEVQNGGQITITP